MQKNILRIIGGIGVIIWAYTYIKNPSFPTPDKLLIFAFFAGLAFNEAIEMIKRVSPFILIMLIYDIFRGFADYLNQNVNYHFMPEFDKFISFGHLPTKVLQNIFWDGHVKWYDFLLYGIYMLHFVLPVALLIFIWKKKPEQYWRYVTAFGLLSCFCFLTYVFYPAAPPWMATEYGVIEPIHRISSDVWWAMGIKDFPSLYNEISPNLVAAVPSLHAAYATLILIFVTKIFRSKWRYLAALYPLGIYFGTVYMGEHYLFDELLGSVYALVAYKLSKPVKSYLVVKYYNYMHPHYRRHKNRLKQFTSGLFR